MVVSARPDGSVRLWDLNGAEPREQATLVAHRDHVIALGFTPDDMSFFSAARDGRVVWWDVESRKRLREWQFPHPVARAALAPDGRHLAIVVENGATYILRLIRPDGALK
jgi:WD40 repeat protein